MSYQCLKKKIQITKQIMDQSFYYLKFQKYERVLFDQIEMFSKNVLSPKLCGLDKDILYNMPSYIYWKLAKKVRRVWCYRYSSDGPKQGTRLSSTWSSPYSQTGYLRFRRLWASFSRVLASINKTFILTTTRSSRLLFYDVLRLSWCFVISWDPKS